jgi:epoxyqueuosine reductase
MPTQNPPSLTVPVPLTMQQLADLAIRIKQLASQFGFADCGITDTDNETAGEQLEQWLDLGYHADMDYMEKHGSKRSTHNMLAYGLLRP